jgi:predicted phosphodiesterase
MNNLFRAMGVGACGVLLAALVYWGLPDGRPAQGGSKSGVQQATGNHNAADAPAGPRFLVGPYLQFPTRTSIKVLWETDLPGTSLVEYGIGEPRLKMEGPPHTTLHEVTLANLQPGTAYVYRASSRLDDGRNLSGPLLTFQAAIEPDSAFSFVAIGDTQKNPTMTGKIAELAWQRRPHFVVHLGDVVDNGPDKNEWVHELFGPCRALFSRVAVFPAIGNHEKNHAYYYRYFSLPEPEFYYHYRYGNADFFVVDTNKDVGPASEQYRWLDRELGRSDAQWKFVYHHHPAYSSDENDWGDTWKGQPTTQGDPNTRRLVTLYEKHNVDMVLNGHIHLYERTWPLRGGKIDRKKGVIYVTSGGGGGSLEKAGPVPTWFKAEWRGDYHFCHISIHGNRLSFRAIDHRDTLFDFFDLEK